MILTLTSYSSGKQIYINSDIIESLREAFDHTEIYVKGNDCPYRVTESVHDVVKTINNADKIHGYCWSKASSINTEDWPTVFSISPCIGDRISDRTIVGIGHEIDHLGSPVVVVELE